MYAQAKIDINDRRPYGAIWGPSNVGKTTALAHAFHDFAFLTTRPGALLGPAGWLEPRGLPMPTTAIQLEDEIDAEGEPIVDWFSEITKLFARLSKMAKAAKKATGESFLPKGNQTIPGVTFEKNVKGIVITEATTLLKWIDRDAKRTLGRSFPTNDKIQAIAGLFSAWNAATGLGLILDCHGGPAEYDEHDVLRETPKIPEGPKWPFRAMRQAVLQDMDFCWELYNEGEGDAREVWVRTRTPSTKSIAIKTATGRDDPEKPFSLHRNEINLTSEEITIRDVLIEAGLVK